MNEEWYITTSKDKGEQLHSGLQDEEKLELLSKESQRTLQEGIKSLMNYHVEPPWRTPVTKE